MKTKETNPTRPESPSPCKQGLKEFNEVQEKKSKVVVLCSRSPQYVKFCISRGRSHAVTAKKSTRKRDARAKMLFCQSKPIAVLPFSLTSALSLLKLRIDKMNQTVVTSEPLKRAKQ